MITRLSTETCCFGFTFWEYYRSLENNRLYAKHNEIPFEAPNFVALVRFFLNLHH